MAQNPIFDPSDVLYPFGSSHYPAYHHTRYPWSSLSHFANYDAAFLLLSVLCLFAVRLSNFSTASVVYFSLVNRRAVKRVGQCLSCNWLWSPFVLISPRSRRTRTGDHDGNVNETVKTNCKRQKEHVNMWNWPDLGVVVHASRATTSIASFQVVVRTWASFWDEGHSRSSAVRDNEARGAGTVETEEIWAKLWMGELQLDVTNTETFFRGSSRCCRRRGACGWPRANFKVMLHWSTCNANLQWYDVARKIVLGGRFFAIFAVLQRVGSFWKRFKSVTCLQIRAKNLRCESALRVNQCKITFMVQFDFSDAVLRASLWTHARCRRCYCLRWILRPRLETTRAQTCAESAWNIRDMWSVLAHINTYSVHSRVDSEVEMQLMNRCSLSFPFIFAGAIHIFSLLVQD